MLLFQRVVSRPHPSFLVSAAGATVEAPVAQSAVRSLLAPSRCSPPLNTFFPPPHPPSPLRCTSLISRHDRPILSHWPCQTTSPNFRDDDSGVYYPEKHRS